MASHASASASCVSMNRETVMEEEYSRVSDLLLEFMSIPTMEKAWVFSSDNECTSRAMVSISQSNLLANRKNRYVRYFNVTKKKEESLSIHWSPFPLETTNASLIAPSPSGSRLLIVKNPVNGSSTLFEIWCSSRLEKEFHIPQSVHGQLYTDGWFEGVSWSSDETLVAYVAEEPSPPNPVFGFKKPNPSENDCNTWKGQGEWEESWGETYEGKRQPALFIIDVLNGGDVHPIKGLERSLSVGQVTWAPTDGSFHCLVFVGWQSGRRKLGIKYCYNRPCSIYAVKVETRCKEVAETQRPVNLTQSITSAFFPRFSPNGEFLVFLSAESSVKSGVHAATNSLHRISWSPDGSFRPSEEVTDVVSVVMCPDDEDGFPGLYCTDILDNPWLADGLTMILCSAWRSREVILSVDVLSGEVARVSPDDSPLSWKPLALDGDNIVAVRSSPVDVPQLLYGIPADHQRSVRRWHGLSEPTFGPVDRCLSEIRFRVLKVPPSIRDDDDDVDDDGHGKPVEAIFVHSKHAGKVDPLIVALHGGPHSVSSSGFSRSLAFLASVGYALLIVNYRGSLGFGEAALQSLPGKIGCQDVGDVMSAVAHVTDLGLADPSRIVLLGGSHGGFLATHLIGQAVGRFAAAAVRNPVCNLAVMVGTSDIPDWCYVEAYGGEKWKSEFTEAPTPQHLSHLYSVSPISHVSSVATPTLFLLGARDLRVPSSTGLQYARALKEKGVATKVIVFPDDVHSIDKPRSEFESYLDIALWFNKYSKGIV